MTLTRDQLLLGAKSVLGEKLTCDPYSISDGREFNVVEPDATNGWRYAQNGAYRGSLNEGAVVQRAMVLATLEEEEPPEEDIGVQRDRWRNLARQRDKCLTKIRDRLGVYLDTPKQPNHSEMMSPEERALLDVREILQKLHTTMSYKDMYYQLLDFEKKGGPTDAGDTLTSSIAQAVVQEGWASVDEQGRYAITSAGHRVLDELRRGIRG